VDRFRFEDYLEWAERDYQQTKAVADGKAPLPPKLLDRKLATASSW